MPISLLVIVALLAGALVGWHLSRRLFVRVLPVLEVRCVWCGGAPSLQLDAGEHDVLACWSCALQTSLPVISWDRSSSI